MTNTERERRGRIIYMATGMVVMLFVLVCCLILAARSFSWFSNSESATATGMGFSSQVPGLIVRTASKDGTPAGKDVGDYMLTGAVEGTDYEMLDLNYTTYLPTIDAIGPGTSGSFDAYLEYTGSQNLTIKFIAKVKADTPHYDESQPYSLYANSHFVFSYEIDDAAAPADNLLTLVPGTEYKLTVSWEWIYDYNALIAELVGNGTIPSNSAADVNAYFQDKLDRYFYDLSWEDFQTNIKKVNNAYNNADLFIATYMNPLFFHVDFVQQ